MKRMPNRTTFCSDIIHRAVSNSRSYCLVPTKMLTGSTLLSVNDIQMFQTTVTT